MDHSIAVEARSETGKGVARKLRAAGRLPAVLYGHGKESQSLSLDPVLLDKLLRTSEAGQNTLIGLEGGGVSGKTVIVKDLQRHPLRGTLIHADFYEVDVNETIVVSVPVHLDGIPIGVSLGGGLLDHALREIELECLPRAIPDELRVDVSALELGDSLHVRDISLPEGVTLQTDEDVSVVSVVAPSVQEEEAAPAEEEAAVEGEAKPDEAGGEAKGD